MNNSTFDRTKQCSNCRDWTRRHTMDDTGVCDSAQQKPDLSYGRIRLDSDGCKHWRDERHNRRSGD